jgi:hypothetical protein
MSNYFPPPEFKNGEEVYNTSTGDIYFVKYTERRVSHMKYAYNVVHCVDLNGNYKCFNEWELRSNETDK